MYHRNIADDEFMENVATDIKYFVSDVGLGLLGPDAESSSSKSVLLFPPVNNYRRFLIHKICDEVTDADLHHFSIGHGNGRRTVVCFTKDLVRVPEEPTMGIDQYHLPSRPLVRHEQDKKWKVMAAIDIYRPPAARRLSAQQAQAANPEPVKPKSKQRRPDIQVYVPRPKRLSASGGDPTSSAAPTPFNRKSIVNVVSEESTSKQVEEHPSDLASNPLRNDTISCSHSFIKLPSTIIDSSGARNKSEVDNHEEPCHYVYANSKQINKVTTYSIDSVSVPVPETIGLSRNIDNSFHKFPPDCSSTANFEQGIEDLCSDHALSEHKSSNTDNNASVHFKPNQLNNVDINTIDMELMELESDTKISELQCSPIDDEMSNDTTYGSEILVSYNRKKCKDTSRNHEEQNRKNRLILHGKVMSDVLVISDPETVQDLKPVSSEKLLETLLPSKTICIPDEIPAVMLDEKEESSNFDISKLNPEECTWEMMFDETGDCLHPHLLEELTSKVGKVTIKSPRSDYKAFVPRTEFQPQDEYSHVLEIYNFSPEFKTQDLVNIFSPYKDKGFEIKWVDDTHALGVFSSSTVAADVLATDHPFVKTRPLYEATAESRVKARRSSEFLRPYRARPETCPALARRLVTGALGVRLKTAKQEREAEKVLLNQAREKKRLEARQKDEAWEGTLGGN